MPSGGHRHTSCLLAALLPGCGALETPQALALLRCSWAGAGYLQALTAFFTPAVQEGVTWDSLLQQVLEVLGPFPGVLCKQSLRLCKQRQSSYVGLHRSFWELLCSQQDPRLPGRCQEVPKKSKAPGSLVC